MVAWQWSLCEVADDGKAEGRTGQESWEAVGQYSFALLSSVNFIEQELLRFK